VALRRRFRLGVVTNGIDRVQRARLAASGLAPLFDVIVTSQSCGYAKPDPRILQVALEALRAQAREAVYVGDDPATDGAAAAAAGVRFVWMDGRRGDGRAAGGRRSTGRLPRQRVGTLRELVRVL
jgi:putative hydrolase of the HAD superfamily